MFFKRLISTDSVPHTFFYFKLVILTKLALYIRFFLEKISQEHKKTSIIIIVIVLLRKKWNLKILILSYLLYQVFDFTLFAYMKNIENVYFGNQHVTFP